MIERPRRIASAVFALFLLVAACGGPREYVRQETQYSLPSSASRFFTTAYDQIYDKYLLPISLGDLVEGGLGNLQTIEPGFAVATVGERVDVRYDSLTIATFDRPRGDEAYRWAQLTIAAVDAGRERSPALRRAEPEAIYQAVIDGALKKLDAFSRYAGRDVARESRASRDGFGGIGISIDGRDGRVLVVSVLEETPAFRAGMKVDDVIVAIDGTPTNGLEVRDVVRKLRGPVGQALNLQVTRVASPAPVSIALTRALIVPPTVTYRREGNSAYIRLISFNQRTTDALGDAFRRARREIGPQLDGIIIDLRGNLGGLLDQAISVSDFFLPEGDIVSTRGRHRASGQVSVASRGDAGEDYPLVLLVNGASASASEIVAAALQDNGRAVVVGTTTFGKGSVQTVIPMPNEGELILTWARFHAPSGYPIADLGVIPAICTSSNEPVRTYIDAVREGKTTSAAIMNDWRAADHSNSGRMKQLRTICPPETKERDVELDVAKRLLSDRGLYARALQSVAIASKAK